MLRFYCSFHSSKKDIIFLFHQVQAPANSHLYSFTILFNFDSNTAMEFQPNRNITKTKQTRANKANHLQQLTLHLTK